MKNKLGGMEITYCSCGQASLGCYGQVQCDCTNPKFPSCAPIGKTIKKTPIACVRNTYIAIDV